MNTSVKKSLMVFLGAVICVQVGLLWGMWRTHRIYQSQVEVLEYSVGSLEQERKVILGEKTQQIRELAAENQKLRQQTTDLVEKIADAPIGRVVQGVNREQLRGIVENTLRYLGEKNVGKFADLLMLTAQIESDLGYHYKQVRGPAVGVFQMEPSTEQSIWNDYLRYQPKLSSKIKDLRSKSKIDGTRDLEWNVAYATGMAYTLYKWRKVDPSKMNTEDMLKIYKSKYNTSAGKSTMEKSIRKILGSKIIKNSPTKKS